MVVTGLGIVSPIGNTVPEAWSSCLAGKPGITRITRFDPSRLSSQIEARDARDAGLAGNARGPGFLDRITDGADDAEPRDDDSATGHSDFT